MTTTGNKRGPGGRREGAGRPSLGADARTVVRTVKLTPAEAARHDDARGSMSWPDWVREACDRAIARGSKH
jgi:hypothetical protein